MSTLLSYPQFSYILKKFLSIENLLDFIGEKSTAPQATENLKAQIDFLKEQCDGVLSASEAAKFGEMSDPDFEVPNPRKIKDCHSS